jgi:hypothetical protein
MARSRQAFRKTLRFCLRQKAAEVIVIFLSLWISVRFGNTDTDIVTENTDAINPHILP